MSKAILRITLFLAVISFLAKLGNDGMPAPYILGKTGNNQPANYCVLRYDPKPEQEDGTMNMKKEKLTAEAAKEQMKRRGATDEPEKKELNDGELEQVAGG